MKLMKCILLLLITLLFLLIGKVTVVQAWSNCADCPDGSVVCLNCWDVCQDQEVCVPQSPGLPDICTIQNVCSQECNGGNTCPLIWEGDFCVTHPTDPSCGNLSPCFKQLCLRHVLRDLCGQLWWGKHV